MSHKNGKKISLAMALLLLTSQPVMASSLQSQKANAVEKKQAIESQMNSVLYNINSTKATSNQVKMEIQILDSQINEASRKISQVQSEISILQGEIERTKEELKQAEDDLAESKLQFSKRMKAMYIANGTGYLDIVLNAKDAESFIGRSKMIANISSQDRELIDEIIEKIHVIEEKKAKLEEQEQSLKQKEAVLANQRASLQAANSQKISYMNSLASNLAAYEDQYNDMLQTSNEIEAQIVKLQSGIDEQNRIAQQKKAQEREEANRKAQEQQVRQKETSTVEETPKSKSTPRPAPVAPTPTPVAPPVVDDNEPSPSVKGSGGFNLPVPGHSRISSGYGYRIHPILNTRKFHSGVDFPAPSGTPIVSAKSGTVIAASFMNGYGNCVMVDHGDMVTVYAHCSSLAVSVGQSVSGGQTIAYVGSTGMSTGPHLHFEVRIGGKTVNPVNYL